VKAGNTRKLTIAEITMKKISVKIILQSDTVISQKQGNKNSIKSSAPKYLVQIYTDITKIFIF
jgi:hypothetical protein